jgi:hypothetical protein
MTRVGGQRARATNCRHSRLNVTLVAEKTGCDVVPPRFWRAQQVREHQVALALMRAAVGRARQPLQLVVVDRARGSRPDDPRRADSAQRLVPGAQRFGEAAHGHRGGRAARALERVAVGANCFGLTAAADASGPRNAPKER